MEMEQGMSVMLGGRELHIWEYFIQLYGGAKQFSGHIIQQTTGEACSKMLIGHPLVNSWPTHHLLMDNAAWGTQASEPLQIVALLLIVLFPGGLKCTRSLCLTASLLSWATHDVKHVCVVVVGGGCLSDAVISEVINVPLATHILKLADNLQHANRKFKNSHSSKLKNQIEIKKKEELVR